MYFLVHVSKSLLIRINKFKKVFLFNKNYNTVIIIFKTYTQMYFLLENKTKTKALKFYGITMMIKKVVNFSMSFHHVTNQDMIV